MTAIIKQSNQRLHLDLRGREIMLTIEDVTDGSERILLSLAEARVLLDALEREIEAAMAPRSQMVDDMARCTRCTRWIATPYTEETRCPQCVEFDTNNEAKGTP